MINNWNHPVIDAHIHFDLYEEANQSGILQNVERFNIKALISVSNNLASAKSNLKLSKADKIIKPAFGYHPEQELPTDHELKSLLSFINEHKKEMIAIGEVGLPYYLRRENPNLDLDAYVDLLDLFIRQATILDKPIILHAIYEDAVIVCDLLEKHSVKKAHFHWFKGDKRTIKRMIRNGYFISITPDVLYEQEIQQIAAHYPLSLMMVETDGPWPFAGPFKNQLTEPKLIHQVIKQLALIKKKDEATVYQKLYENTVQFYSL